MPQEHYIDGERLFNDLMNHFGIGSTVFPYMVGALGELTTAYEAGDWDRIIELAMDEGFDMAEYCVD